MELNNKVREQVVKRKLEMLLMKKALDYLITILYRYADILSSKRYFVYTISLFGNNGNMSSFWFNVKRVLPYKNLEVKDLAFRANVSYSTIINGMNKNSMPHADLAIKISKILNMSLESLLSDEEILIVDNANLTQSELEKRELTLYRKNKIVIDALEKLSPELREALIDIIIKINKFNIS